MMIKFLRISFLFCLLSNVVSMYAQNLVLRAGPNLSKLKVKDGDNEISEGFIPIAGFHIGGTVEFPLSSILSIETGLLHTTKGLRYKERFLDNNGLNTEEDSKLTLYYFDIPVTAKVYAKAGTNKIFGLFGPYIGLGLLGTTKSKRTINGQSNTLNGRVSFGYNERSNDFKTLDYGLLLGAGIKIKRVQLSASYALGLANISVHNDDYKVRNRVFGISIGYEFLSDD